MKILIISTAAIPSPPPDDEKIYNLISSKPTQLSFTKLAQRTFGQAICITCKKEFTKLSPVAKNCCKKCRQVYHLKKLHEWRRNNRQRIKEYSDSTQEFYQNERRRRRAAIRSIWGTWQDWKESEKVAVKILENEGYTNVKHVEEYLLNAVFDIVAFKDNQGYAFQVVTRHSIKKKNQHRFANDINFIHKVIFVSLKNQRYIIKDFSKGGFCELGINEVYNARGYLF